MILRLPANPNEALLAAHLPHLLAALEAGRAAVAASPEAQVFLGVGLQTGAVEVVEDGRVGYAKSFGALGLTKLMRLAPATFEGGLEAACATAVRRLRWAVEEEADEVRPGGGPLVVDDAVVAVLAASDRAGRENRTG